MKGLFTADLQAEWSNLDLCKKAWLRAVSICDEEGLTFICVCGDAKRHYNPVDVRVIDFYRWAVRYARKHSLRVLFVNGNHDRLGQFDDQQNWLAVLKDTGAEVFDKPNVIEMRDGLLAILPWNRSITKLRKQADVLNGWGKWDKKKDVLVFHADLKYADYNQLGRKSEGRLRAKDLHPSNYLACIGGHIHLHQKVGGSGNVIYTGSPFCTDWGEANQSKSFVVVRGASVSSVPTGIPGWFDETWPGFPEHDKRVHAGDGKNRWADTRIRVHVDCDSRSDYGRTLERARTTAERKYPGALIYTVAEFKEKENQKARIHFDDPDEVKIREYVRQTVPQDLDSKLATSYLLAKYKQLKLKALRMENGFRFRKIKAWNFLSFKKFEMKFEPGITIVQGINHDRQGRSNGSGKTSYLQAIPVALFGKTFKGKGQKFDKWARRNTDENSGVTLRGTTGRGQSLRVTRERRPGSLRFEIDHVDQSSGMRSTGEEETQGLLEKVVGYTWSTLANAVYIDQSVTRAFLAGTRKERTEVLARFQNLERFGRAQIFVRKEWSSNREVLQETTLELTATQAQKQENRRELRELKAEHESDRKKIEAHVLAAENEYDRFLKKYTRVSRKKHRRIDRLEKKVGLYNQSMDALEKELHENEFERKELATWIAEVSLLYKDKTCPTCTQPLDHERLQKILKVNQARHDELVQQSHRWVDKRTQLMRKALDLEGRVDLMTGKMGRMQKSLDLKKEGVRFYKQQLAEFQRQEMSAESVLQKKKKRVYELKKREEFLNENLRKQQKKNKLYEYADQAFGRDGIPAFLNEQLVPVLNKAAEYYSELFADKAIQVRYGVIDGEFEIEIVNATGGAGIEDQSAGERAVAGLITSFSLREVAPRTNVLILDEPGEGLDPASARQFARSIDTISKRFGCVYITTHNPAIIGELENAQVVTVEKKNGISYATE